MRENNDGNAFLRQMSQQQQEAPSVMDDMMEQILSMASWNEAQLHHHHNNSSSSSSSAKLPVWDYSSIAGGIAGLESMVALLNTNNNSSHSSSSSQLHHPQHHSGELLDPDHESIGAFPHDASISHGLLENTARAWQQQEQQARGFLDFTKSGSDLLLGKRIRDQEQQQQQQAASLMENLSAISAGQPDGIFSSYGGPQLAHLQNNASGTNERNNGGQVTQGGQKANQHETSNQEGVSHQAGPRPRVRARRGQATDPHSIAERLRRERIAERMKSLQELVPNSNKTDKASMLDEIIDYVKFLQLQVKVLSMSRLGNAGAVSSFMADLPAEESTKFLAALSQNGGAAALQDGISLTERQVAKLMEEDMGSAMQYLQSKGLCLMPIHLASNMSNKSTTSSGQQQQQQQQPQPQPQQLVAAAASTKGTRAKNQQHDSATNSLVIPLKSANVKNAAATTTSSSQH